MKEADMSTFVNYLTYYLKLDEDEISNMTESEFNTIKGYYFKCKEGYELTGGYDDFRKHISKED